MPLRTKNETHEQSLAIFEWWSRGESNPGPKKAHQGRLQLRPYLILMGADRIEECP